MCLFWMDVLNWAQWILDVRIMLLFGGRRGGVWLMWSGVQNIKFFHPRALPIWLKYKGAGRLRRLVKFFKELLVKIIWYTNRSISIHITQLRKKFNILWGLYYEPLQQLTKLQLFKKKTKTVCLGGEGGCRGYVCSKMIRLIFKSIFIPF